MGGAAALAAGSLALFALLACESSPRQPRHGYSLEFVRTYGVEQPDPADTSARRAEGGMLAYVADIAIGDDSAVYVLDADLKKVAVFYSDGGLRRVILGGAGEGPGEFEMPTALDIDHPSRLFVYDHGLGRINVFSVDGQLLHTIPSPFAAKDIVVSGDTIWLSSLPARDSMIVAMDLVGERLFRAIPVTEEDLRFSPERTLARLGRTASGDVLVANRRPGLFYRLVGGVFERFGVEAMPGAAAVSDGEMRILPGDPVGIAELDDGRVIIAYIAKDLSAPPYPRRGMYLDVLTHDGDYLGTAEMRTDFTTAFTARGGDIYVAETEPFPRVVRYRLVQHDD